MPNSILRLASILLVFIFAAFCAQQTSAQKSVLDKPVETEFNAPQDTTKSKDETKPANVAPKINSTPAVATRHHHESGILLSNSYHFVNEVSQPIDHILPLAELRLFVPRNSIVYINENRSDQILEYRFFYLKCKTPGLKNKFTIRLKHNKNEYCHTLNEVKPGGKYVVRWGEDNFVLEPMATAQEVKTFTRRLEAVESKYKAALEATQRAAASAALAAKNAKAEEAIKAGQAANLAAQAALTARTAANMARTQTLTAVEKAKSTSAELKTATTAASDASAAAKLQTAATLQATETAKAHTSDVAEAAASAKEHATTANTAAIEAETHAASANKAAGAAETQAAAANKGAGAAETQASAANMAAGAAAAQIAKAKKAIDDANSALKKTLKLADQYRNMELEKMAAELNDKAARLQAEAILLKAEADKLKAEASKNQ